MRRQLGPPPSRPTDVVTKSYADTKYIKPDDGIPMADLAATGTADETTVLHGDGSWSMILGNTILLTPSESFTLSTPDNPVHGLMVMVEIRPTATVTVTIPTDTIKLTAGMPGSLEIPDSKSGLLGLRYSSAADAWHLIAMTVES